MIPKDLKMLKQAGEFTAYYEKLALLINPYLDEGCNLADFGCGLSLLDFEIASKVASVTAIDIDEIVIGEVEFMIDEELFKGNESARKIHTLVADTRTLPEDMVWDIVLLNFYNVPFEELDSLIARGTKRAIIITDGKSSNSKFHTLSTNRNSYTALDLEKHLSTQGYNFKTEIVDMQFGYPFKTLQDIHEFLGQYYSSEANSDIASNIDVSNNLDKLMASAEERIIKTNRYDYPYYLPKNVSIGIIVITK